MKKMSNDILDIKKWEEQYPFLEEVWNTYKKFDHITEDGNNKYDVLCSSFIFKGLNEELSRYKDFCIRLMKNLGHYSSDPNLYKLTNERCNILFNWLYNSIKEENVTNDIINKCFQEYNYEMGKKRNHNNKCHYFQYNKIHEPINITLLDIFSDKISTIEAALMSSDASINTKGRNFVCECVKIYKYMNNRYCRNGNENIANNSSTCLKLDNFKKSYNWSLYYKSYISPIIPSLDTIDKDLLDKCQEDEKKLRLDSDAGDTQLRYSANSLHTTTEGHGIFSEEGRTINHGNGDSSMKKTITTTIGTVAGASSLLAFLYKFTPAGRMVNSKLRTTRAINNNFYGDGANGILFDGNEYNEFNSYNIGYEAV